MTTSPVMSITDEMVADLEFDLEVAETTHQLEASVSRDALAALLAGMTVEALSYWALIGAAPGFVIGWLEVVR